MVAEKQNETVSQRKKGRPLNDHRATGRAPGAPGLLLLSFAPTNSHNRFGFPVLAAWGISDGLRQIHFLIQ